MKQKDILVIAVVAIVSGFISLLLANFLFSDEKAYQQKAPNVEVISAEFKLPEEKYFNSKSINPTKDIVIGDSVNDNPFKQ